MVVAVTAAALWPRVTNAEFIQQGKLVGTGGTGVIHQGCTVALSADGNTAIAGGWGDNGGAGAAWVFSRAGGAWTQQGGKLVGLGAIGPFPSGQGWSVAVSGDGNLALVGANSDKNNLGAVWAFARSGGTWTQQGDKLVGSGAVGAAQQGWSVALSADGTTALIGGYYDHDGVGAVWVFTRSGGTWTPQGAKLVGSGAVGNAGQGTSVALSYDGNTAIVGGSNDNGQAGAVWVFTRSGATWTQQGGKLVGSSAVGKAHQGQSVAISADGNTATVGGPSDNSNTGAIWVFTRVSGVWVQQGGKLATSGFASVGQSVAVSADGNTLAAGGGSGPGATWVFKRSGGGWTQYYDKLVGTGALGDAQQGQAVAISADGATLLVGGPSDNSSVGAAWVFSGARPLIYVPSTAHSPGVPPTFWKTRFELHNRGTVQAQYSIALLQRDQDNSNPQTANFQLDPGKSVLYTDALADLFGFTGAATLRTTVTAGDLLVSANTYNDQPTGTFGQYIPGLGDDKATSENQEVRVVQLSYSPDSSTGFRTNIGVASACGVAITVNVDLYTKAGVYLGQRTFDLGPYGSKQETNSFSKVTSQAVDSGYAIVKSTTPGARYFAYGSVVENRTGDPIYVPATTAAASSVQTAGAGFIQQGPKLLGTGGIGINIHQGWSVALSGDGNTALEGGYIDNNGAGAAWAFTRQGGAWTQQGSKLVGSGALGSAGQGWSAALSPDGNTALVGGFQDNSGAGAVWVFTRSGTTWTQQGSKLVGSGAVGKPEQGYSVAISQDGNTALVGGPYDNSSTGAAWVFTRSGGTWTQQGDKLVGTGAVGNAQQGNSVAISADGNTAIVGGYGDDSNAGAAWVFTRSGGTWTQQGGKLVGSGAVGKGYQGMSVAVSADGNTAFIGGGPDNTSTGAIWVFTRSGGVWTQQGSKIAGPEAGAYIGQSVSVSADGNIFVTGGGPFGPGGYGAARVFTRSGGVWTLLGNKLQGNDAVGSAQQAQAVAISADGSTILAGGPSDNSSTGGSMGATWAYTNRRATIYVPSTAHSQGVPPTFWKTRFELHNRGTVQVQYSIALLQRDQDNSNPQTANFQLDPGQSVLYTDALSSLFGFTGAATLRTTVTSGDLLVSANTYNDQPTGTYGQFIAGLGDDKATSENQEVRLVQLSYSPDASTGFRTNIGVASACGVAITVNVDLYTKAGVYLGRRTFDLRPYESKQETNSFSKVTSQAVDSGYAIVNSTTPGARYFAYGSVVENRTGDPIYVPAQ
jgi:hypothetical protein